jgi:peptide methionine sulfoxide reductase MsrB
MEKYQKNSEPLSKLSPEHYQVTQKNAAESPKTGEYSNNKTAGVYVDIVSGEPLFSSSDKFEWRHLGHVFTDGPADRGLRSSPPLLPRRYAKNALHYRNVLALASIATRRNAAFRSPHSRSMRAAHRLEIL